METQILLAGDLDLTEKGDWGILKEDTAEIERMLKALLRSFENKPLNLLPLAPLLRLNERRNAQYNYFKRAASNVCEFLAAL